MFTRQGGVPRRFLILPLWIVTASFAGAGAPALSNSTTDDQILSGSELSLAAAVEVAVDQSPALAALNARSSAMAAIPSQAGSLPDPLLSINALNLPVDSFAFDQEPMTQLQVGLSQAIPFPGKRDLKRSAAEFEAGAARAQITEGRDLLVGNVRSAWWRLYHLGKALSIVRQNKALMRDFIEIARTKYSVGSGLQQDVLLAQLELSRLLDRESRLNGQHRNAEATLNILLNRSTTEAVGLPSTPSSVGLPDLPETQELIQQAHDARGLLTMQRQLLEAAETRVSLARRDRYPDFRLGVGYGFRQGGDPLRGERPDFMSLLFSVSVPLYAGGKQNKAIDQRTSEREHRWYVLNDTLRQVEGQITRNVADYEAAREQVALLETAIIPQARQTVSSMLAGYQVNKVDFLNVINGQLTLYNSEINYWESLSRAKQSLARLAATVGKEALYE